MYLQKLGNQISILIADFQAKLKRHTFTVHINISMPNYSSDCSASANQGFSELD